MTTRDLLLSTWSLDPLALAVGLAAAGSWFRELRPRIAAARPEEPLVRVQDGWLLAALGALVVALASPVGALADGYLFSAHMLQHLLLVLAVPPLALLSLRPRSRERSDRPIPWSLPRVAVPWLLGVGAMWLWHEQTLCNAATSSPLVHRLQEVSLLTMGTAFWWPVLSPNHAARLHPLTGIIYLFTGCVMCTILGILVTFSPVEVCSIYLHPVDRLGAMPLLRNDWGLSPARDQQIGGLLMWVPACLVYGCGILGLLARSYQPTAREGGS